MKSRSQAPSMLSPVADTLLGGGLSIIFACGVLAAYWLSDGGFHLEIGIGTTIVLAALIDWPHFTVSYLLLYSSKDRVKRYPGASWVVPGVLLACSLFAWVTTPQLAVTVPGLGAVGMVAAMQLVAFVYLAWHYTGQAFGTTIAFFHVAGISLTAAERTQIGAGCRALLAFHVVFTIKYTFDTQASPTPEVVNSILGIALVVASAVSVIAAVVGLRTFWRLRMRVGKDFPTRAIVPWVALYAWYIVWGVSAEPATILAVQLFHALQYACFPARVGINSLSEAGIHGAWPLWARISSIFVGLVVAGFVLFEVPAMVLSTSSTVPTLVAVSVNIHHYYIDSVIWKLRDPTIRRWVFGHIAAPA